MAAPVGGDLASQTAEGALRAFEFGQFAPMDPAQDVFSLTDLLCLRDECIFLNEVKHSLDNNYKPRKTNERSKGTSDDHRRSSEKERKRNNGRRNHQTATKRMVKIRRRSALICSQRESGISMPMHDLTAPLSAMSSYTRDVTILASRLAPWINLTCPTMLDHPEKIQVDHQRWTIGGGSGGSVASSSLQLSYIFLRTRGEKLTQSLIQSLIGEHSGAG
ncbi:hypothetical protein BDN67DRAFT_491690 [Paxillus ammoniavirescens]|nr:hypothetical protein BDN67DRAFT_491690 [Paxillus ammoniavirescens]